MKKPAKKKPGRLRRPPESTPRDDLAGVTRAVGAATLAAKLPLIGDGIAAFLGAMFPAAFQRRTEAWLREAQQAINELRRRGVDVEALRENEEFADLVLTATQAAMRTRSEEKRRALRNAIVNTGLARAPDEIRRQMFIRLVEEFGDLHLRLLAFMGNPEQWFVRLNKPFPNIHMGGLDHVAAEALPEVGRQRELALLVANELAQRGLTSGSYNGLNMGENLRRSHASALGAEFLRFITEAPDA